MSREEELQKGVVEKELRKAFERTTMNNVLAIQEHSNETRRIVRKLETEVNTLRNNYMSLMRLYEQLNHRYALLQQRLSVGGTTDGDNGRLGNQDN